MGNVETTMPTLHSRLVSIIIPSFNSRKWVCDAIDCSLNQTYQNCEVIVIDDGSTDNTKELLQQKYGNRIKYIYQEKTGVSLAQETQASKMLREITCNFWMLMTKSYRLKSRSKSKY